MNMLKCIKNLGLNPENILYIGDDYEKDYIPAKNNGMNAILIKRKEKHSNILKDNYISDLRELFSN